MNNLTLAFRDMSDLFHSKQTNKRIITAVCGLSIKTQHTTYDE